MKLPHLFMSQHQSIKNMRWNFRYLIAFLIPFAILGILLLPFPEFAKPSASLLLMTGIVLSVWNGGYRSGIFTTLLSAGIFIYFFTSPYGYLAFTDITIISKLILFTLGGIFASILLDKALQHNKVSEFKNQIEILKKKNAELESYVAILKKEIRQRDEFLSVASHELKTPLTSMLLQTQYALHNIRNVSMAHFSIESLLKMLESVENQTRRLSKMINDLLNISLITTGNLQLERESVDLVQAAQDVLEEFAPRIEREKYVVTLIREDEITGKWDKVRIEQAISNLVSNAIKYGRKNPIEITVRKHYGKAEIVVKDNGIGIPKEEQKRVFGLFERGVSPEEFKGLGVGLYITKEIVYAHKGNILLSSKPNYGTKFTIQLPLNT